MKPPTPELLFVAGAGTDHSLVRSMVSQLVENGIHFEFGERRDLPAAIPEDVAKYRAILLDPVAAGSLPDDPGLRTRLEHYAFQGGLVFQLPPPGQPAVAGFFGNLLNDVHTHHVASLLIRHAALTVRHPELERRQCERPDGEILRELASKLLGWLDGMYEWGEFNLHVWRAAMALLEVGGHEDLRKPLQDAIRRCCRNLPEGYDGDEIAGLSGVAWLFGQTGETGPLEGAVRVIDRVLDQRPRTMGSLNFSGLRDDPLGLRARNANDLSASWGLKTTAMRQVSWTESLHLHGATLATLARATGTSRYLDEALRLVELFGRHHIDRDGLIFHGTLEGRPVTGKWGRGHSHALYGLFYILEAMPSGHPQRGFLREMLRTVGVALRTHQDPATGLWRNEIGNPLARVESSCSAGIVAVYGQCLRKGWLEQSEFGEMVGRGWVGLKRMYWRGGLCALCRGTGIGDSAYYAARPQGWGFVPQLAMAWAGAIHCGEEPRQH